MWTLHRTVKQTLGQGGDVLCHQDFSSLILRLFSHFDVLPPLLHIGAIDFQCSITSHFFNSQSWDIATPLPWATSDLSVSGETSWHVMTRDDTWWNVSWQSYQHSEDSNVSTDVWLSHLLPCKGQPSSEGCMSGPVSLQPLLFSLFRIEREGTISFIWRV